MRLFVLFLFILMMGCQFPKDPEHSLEETRENALLVGVAVNPPYTNINADSVFGSEVEIINAFAQKEGLQQKYLVSSESDLVEKLENYEIHLVIGGFEEESLWKKKVGSTVPYDEKHVILIGQGENRFLKKLETFIFQNVKK